LYRNQGEAIVDFGITDVSDLLLGVPHDDWHATGVDYQADKVNELSCFLYLD